MNYGKEEVKIILNLFNADFVFYKNQVIQG